MLRSRGIRSLIGFGRLVGPLVHSVLYHHDPNMRLYLNIFRGEPAISGFDWPFTPIHSSSPKFSALVGSGLHKVLPSLHPGHG